MHFPSTENFQITFTPDAGFGVSVNALRFDMFGGATSVDLHWAIYEDVAGGTVIHSGSTL